MKILQTLWGLLVDDARLAIGIFTSLVIAFILTLAHQNQVAAYVIWLGLLVSLWISVRHQAKVQARKRS